MTQALPVQGALPWLAEPLAAMLDHPAHALLVVGSPGVGAFELQLTLAQAWLCEGGPERPCGQCGSCHLVGARSHPDLVVLLPETQRVARGWEMAEATVAGGAAKRTPSAAASSKPKASPWRAEITAYNSPTFASVRFRAAARIGRW